MEIVINMSSTERLFYNIDNENLEQRSGILVAPVKWPRTGYIKAVNVSARYRTNLPLVLKNISFNIASGERIGIIGRTGSGKSSLMLVFMRLLEIDKKYGGYIEIDGVEIDTVEPIRLRQQISIIPQDPFLLQGNLRYNIDPFDKVSDQEIEEVLRKTLLWDSSLFSQISQENYKEDVIQVTSSL